MKHPGQPSARVGRGRRPGVRHLAQMAAGALLLAGVVAIAGPGRVAGLLRGTDPLWYAGAAGLYALVAVARGLRLVLLAPVRPLEACQLGMVTQALIQVVPARLGELSLPVLLHRVSGLPLSSGAGVLLTVRALDLAAIGAWAGAAIALRWGLGQPLILVASVLLVLPLVFLPLAAAWADRIATRVLAPRGVTGRQWTRRIRRARQALELLRSRPSRLAGALLLTLGGWGVFWAYVWFLLRAVGHPVDLDAVVLGTALATVVTVLPVNLFGSFGTMETGWTAAFAALGVPVAVAAASGLAIHLLSLLVTVLYGLVAAGLLRLDRDRGSRRLMKSSG